MITISVNPIKPELFLHSATKYFDDVYEPEWFDDQLVKEMVLDIDKSVVVSRNVIESPVLGQIPPQWLSGGVKGLILILKYPKKLEYSSCIFGGNCAKWICKLGDIIDYTLIMQHPFELYGDGPLNAIGVNGEDIKTPNEAFFYYCDNHRKVAPVTMEEIEKYLG